MTLRPTFSQRSGLAPISSAFQLGQINVELRNRLWSLILDRCFNQVAFPSIRQGFSNSASKYSLLRDIWDIYFKLPTDTIPEGYTAAIRKIRGWFFETQWHNVYDMVELVSNSMKGREQEVFSIEANRILEQENAGYRIVDGIIAPITDSNEIKEIDQTLSYIDTWRPISEHLSTALSLLSNKTNPDFRNSIKESISAVESAARLLTGDPKPTLGDAVKLIERDGKLHPAMAKALTSLYGYTNDADGIRHSLIEEPNLTYLDAKFMLVVCSAFCNHLRGKAT